MFWGAKIPKPGRKLKTIKMIDCPRKSKGLNLPSHQKMALVGEQLLCKTILIVAGCDSNFLPSFHIFLFLRKSRAFQLFSLGYTLNILSQNLPLTTINSYCTLDYATNLRSKYWFQWQLTTMHAHVNIEFVRCKQFVWQRKVDRRMVELKK